jgi:hypothetical protein
VVTDQGAIIYREAQNLSVRRLPKLLAAAPGFRPAGRTRCAIPSRGSPEPRPPPSSNHPNASSSMAC